MDARRIINVFGGEAALAESLGEDPSKTAEWSAKNAIPPRWQTKLFMLAQKRGLPLSAHDFSSPPMLDAGTRKQNDQVHEQPIVSDVVKPSDNLVFVSGAAQASIRVEGATQAMWATTKEIAAIFEVDSSTVLKHIQNIYAEEELNENATTAKFAVVQMEGGRAVARHVNHYNQDVMISVGYRVSAKRGTYFRKWATETLSTYLKQGYVINEKALRESPEKLDELAAKIRSLRSEEKQIYAKVRECFKICSSDFDPDSRYVRSFYSLLQDKFHHAVTGSTASKLIMDRADHMAENMGLQSMKGDHPTMADATKGKNYLTPHEIYRLHLLSEQFLLYAESRAFNGQNMTMQSLHLQLDRLLTANDYPVLEGYTDYLKDEAMKHAKLELTQYKKRKKIEALGLSYDEDALAEGEYDSFLDGN